MSLFLGMNRIAICEKHQDHTKLVAYAEVSSDAQWEKQFQLLANEYNLQNVKMSVVLSRDFYQTFDIDKPNVNDHELMASLPFAIKEFVTENIFDLVVDYYDRPFQQNKEKQITAVCINKSKVLQIRDMLLNNGLQLNAITIEELALTNLIGNSENVNLLLSEQNNELVLTVVKDGQLYFSHRLRGFNDLLKRPLNETKDILLESLSLELQRVLDYINTQLNLTVIEHIYLAVVCPDIDLLATKLSEYLDRNVVPFGEKGEYDFTNILAYGLLVEDHK